MDKKQVQPATPSQQSVPDPSRSFKPIKTINKGTRGITGGY